MTRMSAITLTVGAVAAALAAGGLSGVGTTTALWSDHATVSGVNVRSGELSIAAQSPTYVVDLHKRSIEFRNAFEARLVGVGLTANLALSSDHPGLEVRPVVAQTMSVDNNVTLGVATGGINGAQRVGAIVTAQDDLTFYGLLVRLLAGGVPLQADLVQKDGGWSTNATKTLRLLDPPQGFDALAARVGATDAMTDAAEPGLATSAPGPDSALIEDGLEPEVAPEGSPDPEGDRDEEQAAPEIPGQEGQSAENDHTGDAPAEEPSADGPVADEIDGPQDTVEPPDTADDVDGRDEAPVADEGDEPAAKEPEHEDENESHAEEEVA